MYVVVVGAGKIGAALARWLVDSDQEVAVIERDAVRCSALEEELGSISVTGDATEIGVQARAGAGRADIFIATTGSDGENMVACQLAKHRHGASRTIALVNVPGHERLFGILGIDMTINTADLIVGRIKHELNGLFVEELRGLG